MKRIYRFLTILYLMVQGVSAAAQISQTIQLGIDEMFALADKNNASIKGFRYAESAAAEAVKTARNDRLPSIDFSASASLLGDGRIWDRDFSNGMKAPIPRFGNNFAIEASQVVYAGGALSAGVAMSELKLQSAQAETEQNSQNIRFLLVGNYLELCKLDNQTEVYRKNIEQTQRLLADIRSRQQEGLAIRNDITRYELQLQRLELALTQTKNSRTIINDRLATALGLDPQQRIEPDRAVIESLPSMLSESQWQQTAADAPSMRLASLGVALSKQAIKLAQAERIPSISLFAGDHLDGPITIEVPPLNKNFNYWYVGVGLNFKISSLYKSGRNVRRAKFASQQAEAFEQLAAENLQSDVREAYIRFNEAFTVCHMQEKNLELAEQNYEVVHNRFLNDLALITDMLDAENAKLSAELDVANARIGILFNYYRLQKVAGNL